MLVGVAAFAVVPSAPAGTWVPSLPTGHRGTDYVSLFPEGTGYAYHSGGSADVPALFITKDFGATWVALPSPPVSYGGIIRFGSPTVGYGVGNGALFKTTDGGLTWVRGRAPVKEDANTIAVYFSLEVANGGRTVVLTGRVFTNEDICFNDTPPARDPNLLPWSLFISHDGGATWQTVPFPSSYQPRSVDYLDAHHGAVVASKVEWVRVGGCHETRGFHDTVFVTRDGGATLTPVLHCASWCTTAVLASPRRILAGSNDGRIAMSSDGGQTFSYRQLVGAVAPPGDMRDWTWVEDIGFADSRVGYAATNGRGVWRTTDGGMTWNRETSTQELYGEGIGDIAVADRQHVLAGGPNFLIRRLPEEDDTGPAPDESLPPPGSGSRSASCRLAKLPDRACTPGRASRRASISRTCRSARERPLAEVTRRRVYANYGVAEADESAFVIDRLIPTALGGSSGVANLWPQRKADKPGAKEKNRLEQTLQARVCARRMTVGRARQLLARDWIKAYRKYVRR